jgi:hypothetical protein
MIAGEAGARCQQSDGNTSWFPRQALAAGFYMLHPND